MNGAEILRFHNKIAERNNELSGAISQLKAELDSGVILNETIVDLFRSCPSVNNLFFGRIENELRILVDKILYSDISAEERGGLQKAFVVLNDVYSDLTELKGKKEEIVKRTLDAILGGENGN